VDVETGEIVRENRPWWAFLSREVNFKGNSSEEDTE
jgi:hypothetical protein